MEQETLPVALYQRNKALVGGRSFGGNMRIGSLVIRNPDVYQSEEVFGVVIEIEDEDEIAVAWLDGFRNTYSIYDLEVICE